MGHLLIGSNTEKILMAVSCPTLSVGAHVLAGIDLRLKLKEILYCSDLTPEAAAAGSYALLLGKAFDVPVEVCNMAATLLDEDPDEARQLAETYCQALRKIMPEAADLWCIPAFHLEHGFELDEIVARAEVESSRLIVLGVHAETQLRRHLHTSFAYQLLTKAVCPVLTIKALPNDS
jgi:nucleotide-binding universal stress UspA family protein